MDDLEKLLGEDTEKDTQAAPPAADKTNTNDGGSATDIKTNGDVAKATESLRKEIVQERKDRKAAEERAQKLEETVARLEKVVKPFEQMGQTTKTTEPDLNTPEGWKGFIGTATEQSVKPLASEIEKIKEANKAKALREFIKVHPEYSLKNEGGKERLQGLLGTYGRIKSRSDVDSEEIAEDLKDAWALQNRSVLEEQSSKAREEQYVAEMTAADIASSGTGNYDKVRSSGQEATALQRKVAGELGISVEDYLKYQSRLR